MRGIYKILGVHITSAKAFACSLANAKKSFYRAFNAVFGKVAGVASEEVMLNLTTYYATSVKTLRHMN